MKASISVSVRVIELGFLVGAHTYTVCSFDQALQRMGDHTVAVNKIEEKSRIYKHAKETRRIKLNFDEIEMLAKNHLKNQAGCRRRSIRKRQMILYKTMGGFNLLP